LLDQSLSWHKHVSILMLLQPKRKLTMDDPVSLVLVSGNGSETCDIWGSYIGADVVQAFFLVSLWSGSSPTFRNSVVPSSSGFSSPSQRVPITHNYVITISFRTALLHKQLDPEQEGAAIVRNVRIYSPNDTTATAHQTWNFRLKTDNKILLINRHKLAIVILTVCHFASVSCYHLIKSNSFPHKQDAKSLFSPMLADERRNII
jgi:hypothetical protein